VGYPPFLNDLERYKEILTQDNIPFSISPFMGSHETRNFPKDYNEEERQILRRLTNDPWGKDETSKKWLDFRINEEKPRGDKMCRMGQTYAIILPNGDVKRCCSPFSKKIGNIFEKDFRILDNPEPCDVNGKGECPCFKAMLVGKEDSWMPLWNVYKHSVYKQEKGIPIRPV
jgi:MoaA/NifB/PqqE/SkfB family radical SAM enzyme